MILKVLYLYYVVTVVTIFLKNEIRLADKEPLQFKENKKIVQSFDFKFI